MKQIDVIGTINKYDPATGEFSGTIGTGYRMFMRLMFDFINGKQWHMQFGKFYKRRTTGHKSQSHKLNGYIQQICEFTGMDFDAVKDYLKRMAIRGGLPSTIDPAGDPVPISETKMTTVNIQPVIIEAEILAGDLSIWLYEGVG